MYDIDKYIDKYIVDYNVIYFDMFKIKIYSDLLYLFTIIICHNNHYNCSNESYESSWSCKWRY